jgi:hypothetical protein
VIRFDDPDDGQDPRHGAFAALALSPDGTTLAVCRRDGVVLFDAATGRAQGDLRVSKRFFYSKLACSPGSPTRLASLSYPWEIQVFDLTTRRKLQGLKPPRTVSGQPLDRLGSQTVETLTFSPDGTLLAASTWANVVFVWEIKNGNLIAGTQEGLGTGWTEGRCILAFTPDRASLLTASRGLQDLGRIYARRRNARTGELVSQIELAQPEKPFPDSYPRAIAPDGKTLVSVGEFRRGDSGDRCYESMLVLYDLSSLFAVAESPRP